MPKPSSPAGTSAGREPPPIRPTSSSPPTPSSSAPSQKTNGVVITGSNTHDLYNQDPKLGPSADLGGPTPTHALRFDSPALDAGHSGDLTTDQRGLPRPIDDPNTPNAAGGDGSDIGAYEADPTLRLTGIGQSGPDVWLSFSSLFGRGYALEWAPEVTGP